MQNYCSNLHYFRNFIIGCIALATAQSNAQIQAYNYQEIFGPEFNVEQSNKIQELITPMVIFGSRKASLTTRLDMYSNVVSVEAEPLLAHLKFYIKPSVFKQIQAPNYNRFVKAMELPNGISLELNDSLVLVVQLSPEILKEINSELSSDKPIKRLPFGKKIISSVHDVDLDLTQLNEEYSPQVNIDSSFRYNRVMLTGSSLHKDHETTVFKDNWVAKFEDLDKSYFYGHIQNPTFSSLTAKKLSTGIAVGNTDLKKNIIFENDAKYINLTYPADVKIYIDNILHEEKSFASGRHKLNIPLQDDLFQVRIEVKDIHGRYKEYDLSAAGVGVEAIPVKGAYTYFLSAGTNENNKKQIYAGVSTGLSSISKSQLAVNYKTDHASVAAQYYRIIPKGTIRSTLSGSHTPAQNGFGVKSETGFKWNNNLTINLAHEYNKNLNLDGNQSSNSHTFKIDSGYRFSDQWSIRSSLKQDIRSNTQDYSLASKHHLSKDLVLTINHDKSEGRSSYSGVGLSYQFGSMPHRIDTKYQSDTRGLSSNAYYEFDSNSAIDFNHSNSERKLSYRNHGDIFKSKATLYHKSNNTKEYKLESRFSIVTTEDSVALSPTVGNYYGFNIFEASDDFAGEIVLKYQSSRCRIKSSEKCVLLIDPEEEKEILYEIDKLPTGIKISPAKIITRVPAKGGNNFKIDTRESLFAQGFIVDEINKPVTLLVGSIVDYSGNKITTFSDNSGYFFIELAEGQYSYKAPGYEPAAFTISKDQAEDGVINLGKIKLDWVVF